MALISESPIGAGLTKTWQKPAIAIFLAARLLTALQPALWSAVLAHGSAQAHKPDLPASGNPPQTTEQLQALRVKCLEAAKRLQHDVLTMEPGRTWRWRLDSERSRRQIVGLRHDLRAFWSAEAGFEANLPPNQKSKLNSQFVQIHNLFELLDRDAQSLDTELEKGYPTRWHVARDVTDMRVEINHWTNLDRRIADDLGLKK